MLTYRNLELQKFSGRTPKCPAFRRGSKGRRMGERIIMEKGKGRNWRKGKKKERERAEKDSIERSRSSMQNIYRYTTDSTDIVHRSSISGYRFRVRP